MIKYILQKVEDFFGLFFPSLSTREKREVAGVFFSSLILFIVLLKIGKDLAKFWFLHNLLIPFYAFLLGASFTYFYVYYLVEKKKERIDEALPSFLLILYSRLVSGLSPYTALARDVEKIKKGLKEEIKRLLDIWEIEGMEKAFATVIATTPSNFLRNFLSIFYYNLVVGGKITKTISTFLTEITARMEWKKRVRSQVAAYAMMSLFIVVILLPFLLSVLKLYIVTLSKSIEEMKVEETSTLFTIEKPKISQEEFEKFAFFYIVINGILFSMFVGVIERGHVRSGIKYFLPITIFAFVVYYFSSKFVSTLLF